ncbi:MAG TPA: type 4a pilus biogenesis protein PilO [Candidatus Saccharimonadales bacterium]|nr:type 4a pilus biogenesis protein PilO [Candidatus Saccharimonadales bacterium]
MTPQKYFYILAGILAVVLLGGGAGYYYATSNLTEGTITLSQRQADKDLADEKLSKFQDLDKQYHKLAPVIAQLDEALPKDKRQSELSLQLQNIASASGMRIDSITFPTSNTPGPTSQTTKVGDILALPVTFQLHGTYGQLQAFLQRQERLNRYTSMTALDISGGGSALNFAIQLNAFLKP